MYRMIIASFDLLRLPELRSIRPDTVIFENAALCPENASAALKSMQAAHLKGAPIEGGFIGHMRRGSLFQMVVLHSAIPIRRAALAMVPEVVSHLAHLSEDRTLYKLDRSGCMPHSIFEKLMLETIPYVDSTLDHWALSPIYEHEGLPAGSLLPLACGAWSCS